MMNGDAGVEIAFALLEGGLIDRTTSLGEAIKRLPGKLYAHNCMIPTIYSV